MFLTKPKQPSWCKGKRQGPLEYAKVIEPRDADNVIITRPTFPNPSCEISDS